MGCRQIGEQIAVLSLERPDVADELRNVVHYLTRVFPEVVPRVDDRLRAAWKSTGLDPVLLDAEALPRVSFGTWVGGDRDGHPLVTAEVTQNTLLKLRLNAFVVIRRKLKRLVDEIPDAPLLYPFSEPINGRQRIADGR